MTKKRKAIFNAVLQCTKVERESLLIFYKIFDSEWLDFIYDLWKTTKHFLFLTLVNNIIIVDHSQEHRIHYTAPVFSVLHRRP